MSMNTNQVLQDVTVEMTAEQEACRKAEKRRFVIAVVIAILGTLTAFSESGDGNASLVGMMIGTPMAFLLFGGIPDRVRQSGNGYGSASWICIPLETIWT